MDISKKHALKHALLIASTCIITYFVSYYVRNLLSVLTPQMLSDGFDKGIIGIFSSVYMLVYAIGQLLNGPIGDIVRPKYMVLIGLGVAGLSSVLFSFVTVTVLQVLIFALLGFSLSMLRGPIVKTICENLSTKYSHVACVFLFVTCTAGPLVASLLSIMFNWKTAFAVAGFSAVLFSVLAFVLMSAFEKRNIIAVENKVKVKKAHIGFIKIFRLENFVYYMLIGMICEIFGTTVTFWLPTYLVEHLGFNDAAAGLIYSAISLIKTFTPFAVLFMMKLFKNKDVKLSFFTFFAATLLFVFAAFAENKWVNIVLVLFALILVQLPSAIVWNIYIPNQASSGLVSTLNGFLDFSGYVAATLANLLFSAIVSYIGWGTVSFIWCSIPALGAVAAVVLMVTTVLKKKKQE